MRRFILFYGCITIALIVLGVILWIQAGADKTLIRYQKTVAFSPREMTYSDVVHPVLGEGVVLSRVQFPSWRIPHQIGRMLMRLTPTQIQLKMSVVQVFVGQGLVRSYGEALTDVLRAYHPGKDTLIKPWETVALLGLDTLTGDADITLEPRGETTVVTARFSRAGRTILTVSGTVYVASSEQGRLWGWLYGLVPAITVEISDIDLLRAYAGYLQASGYLLPPALETALMRQEPLAFQIDLNPPVRPVDVLS